MPAILLTLLVLLAGPAVAQDSSGDEPEPAFQGTEIVWPEFGDAPDDAPTARIGFVFDPVQRTREASITVGEPVEVLLVAWGVQVALHAWEANVRIDPRLTVIERDLEADLHLDLQDGDLLAMLEPENCNPSREIVLARYQLLLMEEGAEDLVLGLGPIAKPTELTVETDAPRPSPAYQVCRKDKDIRPFLYDEVSAVLNPVNVHPVPIEGERPRFDPAPARRKH